MGYQGNDQSDEDYRCRDERAAEVEAGHDRPLAGRLSQSCPWLPMYSNRRMRCPYPDG